MVPNGRYSHARSIHCWRDETGRGTDAKVTKRTVANKSILGRIQIVYRRVLRASSNTIKETRQSSKNMTNGHEPRVSMTPTHVSFQQNWTSCSLKTPAILPTRNDTLSCSQNYDRRLDENGKFARQMWRKHDVIWEH